MNALANATDATVDRLVITDTPIRSLEKYDLAPLLSMTLYRLALINNGIEYIAVNAFAPVRGNLLALDLSDNGLEKIDANLLMGADLMISFAAQGNRISVVEDRAFANLSSLCYIDLSFNRLETLPANLLSGSFKRSPGSVVPRMFYACGKHYNLLLFHFFYFLLSHLLHI
jgi:Leucine-rich repeat (LRR) protein